MNQLLSVVVPVYNAEAYLPECMESLLKQTYSHIEIILVDDGSKDGSSLMCDRYAAQNTNVSVIHKENGGVHSARNCGLLAAHGEYITFVDADDCLDCDAYEIAMKCIQKEKLDVIGFGYKTEYGKHFEINQPHSANADVEIIEGRTACMLSVRGKMEGFVWNKLFKVSKIGELRFRDNIPICDDLYFSFEFMNKTDRAGYIDLPLYHYRYVATSLSKKSSMKRFVECLDGMYEMCQWVDSVEPACRDLVYTNYIFWITKSCERMLYSYDNEAFGIFQNKMRQVESFIPQCGKRAQFLANGVLRSWRSYRMRGLFFWYLKKIYLLIH